MVDTKVRNWIVLCSNSHHSVTAYGTNTGMAFQSGLTANHMKRQLEKEFPSLDFLVLPVLMNPSKTNPEIYK